MHGSVSSRTGSMGLLACCALLAGCNFLTTVHDLPMATLWQATPTTLESARALEREGKLEQALAAYWKLSEQSDCPPPVWHRLAVVNDRMGNFETANRYYDLALEADDANPLLLCDYGYRCYLQGKLELAEVALTLALDLQSEMPRAHNNLGLVYARQGRHKEAENQFLLAGCSDDEAQTNWLLATTKDSDL